MRIRLLYFSFSLTILIISTPAKAQNNDILRELNKDKKIKESYSSSSSYSNNYRGSALDGIIILLDIFRFFGTGGVYLQQKALEQRPTFREITSVEASLNAGYYSKYNALLFSPQIKANWGVFSTDFRYQRTDDKQNILETYDWQILKLNIPIRYFKASFGMGFTRVPQIDISYFEYTISGQLRFYKEKLLAEAVYRSASAFRKEMKLTLDYELKRYYVTEKTAFHICPMIGFTYQNYFSRFNQYYFQAGINLRFY